MELFPLLFETINLKGDNVNKTIYASLSKITHICSELIYKLMQHKQYSKFYSSLLEAFLLSSVTRDLYIFARRKCISLKCNL